MPPGTLTLKRSDATSFVYEASDPEGVYLLGAWYKKSGSAPRVENFRIGGCPQRTTVTIPREQRYAGQPFALFEVVIVDCAHLATGVHGKTAFAIDARGTPEQTRIQEVPAHEQWLLEKADEQLKGLEEIERRQRWILLLLLLLILLVLWSTLGPLFA